ncbi:tail fiber domain-containing protein [Limnovirga soli]|nr:tail fiber domain-containing protein [Limnovirga soli]
MKYKIWLPLLLLLTVQQSKAQNIFPAAGRAGIYTTNPSATLQVKGGARFGASNANYINIDSATGNLSFNGSSQYRVGGNQYAFAFSGNPNYGLYFNQTNVRYEFRNNAAAPSFYVGADDGNGVFTGGVRVGNSNSAVAGNIRWANGDFQGYNGTAWVSLTGSGASNGADKSLGNLIAPTALNVDLLPNATNTISLGSTTFRYEDVHLFNLKFSNGTTQTTAFTPYNAGDGISISSNSIANTAPDQTVVLNPGTGISVGGTYPNFTIASTLTGSQWATGTDNISYTVGNVGIGTTTPQAKLEIVNGDAKINGITIGRGNGIGGNLNTAFGVTALVSNTTGSFNTATGFAAMQLNSSGSNNTANGYAALFKNSTGSSNAAVGVGALFENTTGKSNSAFGVNALSFNTTGNTNVAFGVAALFSNSSGRSNVAIGVDALRSNTTGNNQVAIGDSALYNQSGGAGQNIALGSKSLFANTSGSRNTATGFNAMFSNTTGFLNVANGYNALFSNTIGVFNVATGSGALESNTTGHSNVANGKDALFSNSTGYFNVANGSGSLASNSTGYSNVATGSGALFSNTTGFSNVAYGINSLLSNQTGSNLVAIGDSALLNQNGGNGFNTAVGSKALFANITGQENTATGYNALLNNTGNFNTAFGTNALVNNTTGISNVGIGTNAIIANSTGGNNTAIGVNALNINATGSNNTAIGRSANVSVGNLTNATAVGNGAITDASNKIRFGNTAVTSIGGQVSYTTFSDGRFKQNIKEETHGLDFIKKLKPVSYNYNVNSIDNFWGIKESTEDKANADVQKAKAVQLKKRYTGFLAQDVDKAAQSVGYDFSGIDKPEDDSKSTWGLRYSDFVVPLVNAVQELSKQNDELFKKNDELSKQNDYLQQQIEEIKRMITANSNAMPENTTTQQAVLSSIDASLSQNIPNPFNNYTVIRYQVPQQSKQAVINITAADGKIVKLINLSAKNNGQLNLQTSELAAGTYRYSLIVDGKLIDTKTMVLIK